MLIYLAFLLVGLVAGTVGGFVGVGGAIIIIPALIFFFGYDQLRAQGTSLAVLIPPVALLAFWQYYKNPAIRIDFLAAGLIALGVLIGGLFGGRLANHLDPTTVRKVFSIFLVCVGIYLFIKR